MKQCAGNALPHETERKAAAKGYGDHDGVEVPDMRASPESGVSGRWEITAPLRSHYARIRSR